MMGMNKTANTETKDRKIMKILNDVNGSISQLSEIYTILNERIVCLEAEVKMLKTDVRNLYRLY
jgi:hypothetical protein